MNSYSNSKSSKSSTVTLYLDENGNLITENNVPALYKLFFYKLPKQMIGKIMLVDLSTDKVVLEISDAISCALWHDNKYKRLTNSKLSSDFYDCLTNRKYLHDIYIYLFTLCFKYISAEA